MLHNTPPKRIGRAEFHTLLATSVVACFMANRADAQATFTGLGHLAGGSPVQSFAYGVSWDGSIIAGTSTSMPGLQAFRWTSATGLQGLGDVPGGVGNFESLAYAISGDGLTIAGSGSGQAYRWTSGGGIQILNDLPGGGGGSAGFAVNGDGSVIVGYGTGLQGQEAVRWTNGGAPQGLGFLPGGTGYSRAYGVSGDGSIIVGESDSTTAFYEAFRWTAGGGMQSLGFLNAGDTLSSAGAISADGSTIVGFSGTSTSGRAFRWTLATGMQDLGGHNLGQSLGAGAVSGNGSIIVGSVYQGGQTFRATIWDEVHGMRLLQDVLQNDFGLNLNGWFLTNAEGVSFDGTTIVGYGFHNGIYEAFTATIPEPMTLGLLMFAGMHRSRRRK